MLAATVRRLGSRLTLKKAVDIGLEEEDMFCFVSDMEETKGEETTEEETKEKETAEEETKNEVTEEKETKDEENTADTKEEEREEMGTIERESNKDESKEKESREVKITGSVTTGEEIAEEVFEEREISSLVWKEEKQKRRPKKKKEKKVCESTVVTEEGFDAPVVKETLDLAKMEVTLDQEGQALDVNQEEQTLDVVHKGEILDGIKENETLLGENQDKLTLDVFHSDDVVISADEQKQTGSIRPIQGESTLKKVSIVGERQTRHEEIEDINVRREGEGESFFSLGIKLMSSFLTLSDAELDQTEQCMIELGKEVSFRTFPFFRSFYREGEGGVKI